MSGWQLFFVAMAIWNLGAALPGLMAPRRGFRLLYGVDTDRFYELYQHWVISAVILLYGISYAIVALDPASNLGLVFFGILGKLFFVLVVVTLFVRKKVTLVALAMGVCDAAFAVFFARYLMGSVFFINELVGGG